MVLLLFNSAHLELSNMLDSLFFFFFYEISSFIEIKTMKNFHSNE